jgi:WD40 repeat protein
LEGVLRQPAKGKRGGSVVKKSNNPAKILFFGLVIFLGFTTLTNFLSAESNIEIKKEKVKIKDKVIECWSWPKAPDNTPCFYKVLQKIGDFANYVVSFKKTDELPFGKSVAFLVGVSKYKYLNSLSFVDNDLNELATTLLTYCGFDAVYIAKNEAVSPDTIKTVLLNKFSKELNKNDRLLFYYSGHGADLGGNTGYMQFSNCKTNKAEIDYNNDVLRVDEVKEWSNLIEVNHILFIFDSCVSGWGLAKEGKVSTQPTCLAVSGNGSRTAITAGTGKERAYGDNKYSFFTRAFLTTLKNDNLYQKNNGFLTIDEIFFQVKQRVMVQSDKKQNPHIWDLDVEEKYRGNFLFINSNISKIQLSSNDLQILHAIPRGKEETKNVGAVGIIQLTSYFSGTVYIDDVGVSKIEKGDVQKYYDQPIGPHTIKIVNGQTIAVGIVNVVKGEITPLRITVPVLENKPSEKKSPAEVFVQLGHFGDVTSVAFSPDGKYALSGSEDQTLKLWDISSGKEIRNFTGHSRSVYSVAFSPDGKYALSGSWDGTLKLWNISSGKEIRSFTEDSDFVNSVAFSPDGKYALSGSGDNTKLWEISSGKEIRRFTGHSDSVQSVAFSPDGKYALSGSGDNTLKLWEISSGKEIRRLTGHFDSVHSVAFSPDGKYALSGSCDKTLKLWEISSGKEIRSFTGHSRSVYSVAFSPDGKYALSGSGDKTLKLWEISSGKEIKSFTGHSDFVNSVAFSPDGKYALSGSEDKTLKLWEITSGKKIRSFTRYYGIQ